ncbi:MAG: helix-turn-helix domain-containing protein [Treponema sp.]|nr:helix-turn-helix domain-containing protein [Treponema sp.]
MTYSNIKNKSSLDLCLSLGQSIDTDIKQKHLPKQEVAQRAGITVGTLNRICEGKNVKLQSVIKVLKVVNRDSALMALVTPSPVEPISLYDDMVSEIRLRKGLASIKGRRSSERRENRRPVTAQDVRNMCIQCH